MASKDAPDSTCILQFRLPDLELLKRDSLAVEHSIDVVVGLDKEFGRIGERLVPGKPRCLLMPGRTNDRQGSDLLIKCLGDLSGASFCREQTVLMDEHDFDSTFSLCASSSVPKKIGSDYHGRNFFLVQLISSVFHWL
jgi:hypothetical protein